MITLVNVVPSITTALYYITALYYTTSIPPLHYTTTLYHSPILYHPLYYITPYTISHTLPNSYAVYSFCEGDISCSTPKATTPAAKSYSFASDPGHGNYTYHHLHHHHLHHHHYHHRHLHHHHHHHHHHHFLYI